MKRRWKAFKTIVSVWVDLFDEHGLLTSAAAIALQAFVAMVALALLALALIGATGHQHVWSGQIAPQLEPKFLPEVYAGISATVEKVFSTDSTTLIVIAVLLAVWEVSPIPARQEAVRPTLPPMRRCPARHRVPPLPLLGTLPSASDAVPARAA